MMVAETKALMEEAVVMAMTAVLHEREEDVRCLTIHNVVVVTD